jgi:hypothetical protein
MYEFGKVFRFRKRNNGKLKIENNRKKEKENCY